MIKVKNRKLLLLPGDGIGPEVVNEVKKITEENMMTVSFFCRMAVHNMVNDINNKRINIF